MSQTIDMVRLKYPQYRDMSDEDLTLAIGKKYPMYFKDDPWFEAEFNNVSFGGKLATGTTFQPNVPLFKEPNGPVTSEQRFAGDVSLPSVVAKTLQSSGQEVGNVVGNQLGLQGFPQQPVPQTVGQGLHQGAVNVAASFVNPEMAPLALAPALESLRFLPYAKTLVRGGLAAMVTPGVTQGLGVATAPGISTPQRVQGGVEAAGGGLGLLPFAGRVNEAVLPIKQALAEHAELTRPPQPLPPNVAGAPGYIEYTNARLRRQALSSRPAQVSTPVEQQHTPQTEPIQPTATSSNIEFKNQARSLSSEELESRRQAAAGKARVLVQSGKLDAATPFIQQAQSLRELLEERGQQVEPISLKPQPKNLSSIPASDERFANEGEVVAHAFQRPATSLQLILQDAVKAGSITKEQSNKYNRQIFELGQSLGQKANQKTLTETDRDNALNSLKQITTEVQNASSKSSTTGIPSGQQGARVDEEASLQQQGAVTETGQQKGQPQGQVQAAPEKAVPGGVGTVPRPASGGHVESARIKMIRSIPEKNRNDAMRKELAEYEGKVGNVGLSSQTGAVMFGGDVDLSSLGFKGTGENKVNGEQLYNRIRNVIGGQSSEFSYYEEKGLRQFLSQGRSIPEVQKWMEENGPKVEVRKFGVGGQLPEQKELRDLEHEWYDSLQRQQKNDFHNFNAVIDNDLNKLSNWSQKDIDKAVRYKELLLKESSFPRSEQSHWQSIAPKSEQDMPGYTEIAVVKPRTAVRDARTGELEQNAQFPSSHSFPPNTLGFVRGYMETTKSGEKVFHIIEVQSDWAQQARDQKEVSDRRFYTGDTEQERIQQREQELKSRRSLQDPLLSHYERLALKAAIEHARSEGATKIAISDAETAMMTEGHDRGGGSYDIIGPNDEVLGSYDSIENARYDLQHFPKGSTVKLAREPEQAKGMRLHYDRTLPKIAEELTGDKGQKVSFGFHKNAFENDFNDEITEKNASSLARKDLIFRSESGQPKTDVSARVFDISKTEPRRFTMFGRDRFKEAGALFPKKQGQGQAMLGQNVPRQTVTALGQLRNKLVTAIRSRVPKADIVRFRDAADNMAKIAGQQSGNRVKLMARDLFGPVSKQALDAVNAAVEAKGDKDKLDKFIAQAANDKRGLAAATFAKNNWDRLQPLVDAVNNLHEMQWQDEVNNGIDTPKREGYIRHVFDLTKIPSQLADKFFSSSGIGGSGFIKQRVFDTLYDAIEAGYGDAIKSWDSSKLVENRIKGGQQMVNDVQWLKGLKNLEDPTTHKPLVTEPIRRKNPKTGDVNLVPPHGYEMWSPFFGQNFAVHRGYKALLNSVTAPSWLDSMEAFGIPVGHAINLTAGTLKHTLLMYDTYHAVRMTAKKVSLTGNAGYNRGLSLLEYSDKDLDTALRLGDIDKPTYDYAKANRDKATLYIKNGLNVGRVSEQMYSDIIQFIPYAKTANKWIFEKLTRGAMMESAIVEGDRIKKAQPSLSDNEVAKQVVKNINTYFGNLGRQGFLRSKSAQDVARFIFLAPQWVESMARTEVGTISQTAKWLTNPTRPIGTLAKGTTALLLAMFVATQITNMFTTGHPTWQNEDQEHLTDAWIPGGRYGQWVSPFSLPMELTHDVIRYLHTKSPGDTITQIFGNKLAPLARAGSTLISGRDYTGRKLSDVERVEAAGTSLIPAPLPLQAGVKSFKGQPGALQRQILASGGLKVEPARSPFSTIKTVADRYKQQHNIHTNPEPEVSPYQDLRQALQEKDEKRAKEAYQSLLEEDRWRHPTLNTDQANAETEKNIRTYFKQLENYRFINKENEADFRAGLTPNLRKQYDAAISEQQQLHTEFTKIFGQDPQKGGFKFRENRLRSISHF